MDNNQEIVFSQASSIQNGIRFTLIVKGSKKYMQQHIPKKIQSFIISGSANFI